MALCRLVVIAAAIVSIPGAISAPKRKSSSAASGAITYNEKQKGDYNIRLHMKDFQIIALLGEDPLSGFDDYDYNYDYADLTVKPVLPTFTLPPLRPTNGNGTAPVTAWPPKPAEILLLLAQQGFPPTSSTEQPDSVEHKVTTATVTTTTTEKNKPSPADAQEEQTVPVIVLQPTTESENGEKTNKTAVTTPKPEREEDKNSSDQSAESNVTSQRVSDTTQPQPFLYVPQIVFNLQEEADDQKEAVVASNDKKNITDQTDKPASSDEFAQNANVSSTTKDDDEPSSMATTLPVRKRPGFSSGHVRMCALGFMRDKRGRCRRISRKPGQQLQYGIRLANMANQLKNAAASEPTT